MKNLNLKILAQSPIRICFSSKFLYRDYRHTWYSLRDFQDSLENARWDPHAREYLTRDAPDVPFYLMKLNWKCWLGRRTGNSQYIRVLRTADSRYGKSRRTRTPLFHALRTTNLVGCTLIRTNWRNSMCTAHVSIRDAEYVYVTIHNWRRIH